MKDITLANIVLGPNRRTLPPLGVLYLTSVLEAEGYTVDLRDYQANSFENPFSVKNLLSFLDNSSDILGISCNFGLLPLVILAMEKMKTRQPDKTIILGGPGPTAVSREILERFPFIDIVARGEGERTIIELMNSLKEGKDLEGIDGISYRCENEVHVNPSRKLIKNLDEIPLPAYHRIDFEKYPIPGVMSSRGCPFHCTFCEVSPLWGRIIRLRSVDNVVEELKLLQGRYKKKEFCFNDDLFVFKKSRTIEFCRKLKKEQLDFKWSCLARVDTIDRALMKEMYESGCREIQYGVESGSNRILGILRKGFTKQVAFSTLKESISHFDRVLATFIWGFPFETMDDFYETVFYVSSLTKIGCEAKFNLLAPAPLSTIYIENRHLIRFSEELSPDMVWRGFEEWDRNNVIEIIRDHPEVFPDFYYFHSDNVYKKCEILKKCELWP